MEFESELFGPSFSYPPGERRRLPTEATLHSYLASLTLSPLNKRPTLDTAPSTLALELEDLSLGLSFRRIDGCLKANDTLLEEQHSLHIGSNSWIHGNYYSRILAQFAGKVHTAEFRKIIELLRSNKYVRHGPEKALYEEIAERKKQYPDFPPMLLISPAFLFYLSNTRPMTKDGSRLYYGYDGVKSLLASLHTEFEGCLLLIEPCNKEYKEEGEDATENLKFLRDFEFVVLARPQIETEFRYEYCYSLNRVPRAWKAEINLNAWLNVTLLPRESQQTSQDKAEYILAKNASRFLDISHELEV